VRYVIYIYIYVVSRLRVNGFLLRGLKLLSFVNNTNIAVLVVTLFALVRHLRGTCCLHPHSSAFVTTCNLNGNLPTPWMIVLFLSALKWDRILFRIVGIFLQN
jgi:hypothetical protein